ncbi:MAG: hypothetical protein U1E36_09215 [Rickettsiales bacterium]
MYEQGALKNRIIPESLRNLAGRATRKKAKDDIEFRPNGVLTLGVEIELQMIDPAVYNLASRAEELLTATKTY